MNIGTRVLVLIGFGVLATVEFLLIDGWRDFQRLRHSRLIALPEGFNQCLEIAEIEGWSSPQFAGPLQVIVIHDCQPVLPSL